MPAPVLTLDDARRWTAASWPRWPRVLLIAGWVLALVVALTGSDTPCSAEDPSVCGPSVGLSLLLPFALATPFLLWWAFPLGAAAGVLFGALDLAFDDVGSTRIAFGLHAAACAVGFWAWRSGRESQRGQAAAAGGGATAEIAPWLVPPGRPWRPAWVAAGLVALVAGAGLVALHGVQVAAEQEHLDRAREVQATVVSTSGEDSTATLSLGLDATRTVVVDVLTPGEYPAGRVVPVLVDPADPQWARLVAEPYDATLTLSAAALVTALGGYLLVVEVMRRRRLQQLGSGARPALTVDALALPDRVLLAVGPDGVRHLVGELRHGTSEDVGELVGVDFRGEWREVPGVVDSSPDEIRAEEGWQRAVLLGDLRDRGTAAALMLGGTRLRDGVLRLEPGCPRVSEAPRPAAAREERAETDGDDLYQDDLYQDDLGDDDSPTPTEVFGPLAAPVRSLPPLPLVVRETRARRATALGGLAFVAVGLAVAAAAFGSAAAPALGVAGAAAVSLVGRLRLMILTAEGMTLPGAWRATTVPWGAVHGARSQGPGVAVAYAGPGGEPSMVGSDDLGALPGAGGLPAGLWLGGVVEALRTEDGQVVASTGWRPWPGLAALVLVAGAYGVGTLLG